MKKPTIEVKTFDADIPFFKKDDPIGEGRINLKEWLVKANEKIADKI